MAYLKNWSDNFFQKCFMGTSWVAVSINNIKTRASSEMTSRKNINMFYFNGVNVAKHWHVARYLPSLIALLILHVVCCIVIFKYWLRLKCNVISILFTSRDMSPELQLYQNGCSFCCSAKIIVDFAKII